eukprot:5594913-Prymnesium_polylepis.1
MTVDHRLVFRCIATLVAHVGAGAAFEEHLDDGQIANGCCHVKAGAAFIMWGLDVAPEFDELPNNVEFAIAYCAAQLRCLLLLAVSKLAAE